MVTVMERVVSIVADKLGVEEDKVTSEASFVDTLNADSLDLVELIIQQLPSEKQLFIKIKL